MNMVEETGPRRADVTFSGSAGEYFKIWIVNVALTVVTLGIYSAWAKVRKLRYFYGNTSIEDGHFDYHARPKAILIGRLIAVGFLLIYYVSSQYVPMLGLLIIVLVMLGIPWLMVRSMVFQLRNTSYHGLRFNFQRNYADSFKAFYGGALITLVTFGFGAPTAIYMRNKFAAVNAGYGNTQFAWSGTQGEFYSIVWKSIGLSLIGAVLITIVLVPMMSALTPQQLAADDGMQPGAPSAMFMTLITLPLFVFYAAIGIYVQVRLKNYVWNTLTLSDSSFESTLSVRKMLWLYLSNAAAIILSIGLLAPRAQIRMVRYRAECMTLNLCDDWRDYKASQDSEGSALGEEIGEVFDVEIDVAF
jgi:uncharacterized membrane protein YjgN (DUF898 family)